MTESEEMYLVSIARIKENGEEGPVALSRLAEELSVLPVSVNQMIRKLEECDLVSYMPYKGVELTEKGLKLALQILRHRRLWEVFLVEDLKISAVEAGDLSCRLEHILPEDVAERLASYLGSPAFNPRGEPIPPAEEAQLTRDLPIHALQIDECGQISRVEADPAGRAFLLSESIRAGETVRVMAISGSGNLLVQNALGNMVCLSPSLAKTVWVQKNPGN